MPFKSTAQQAWMAIHKPDLLKKWAREYGGIRKGLPKHVKPKPRPR